MPVAEGRPDANDLQIAEQFGKDCLKKLKDSDAPTNFFIKGNVPYRHVGPSTPAAPLCTEECFACGECIEVCPTHAIYLNEEGKIATEIAKCIKCCACVKACTKKARIYDTPFAALLSDCFKKQKLPQTIL